MTIKIEHLSYSYHSQIAGVTDALSDISLDVQQGEIVALAGASGSGKTTLIQQLNGLLTPTQGRVLIDGSDIADPGTDLQSLRKKIGLVFQFPEIQLFEETVFDDVAFGPRNLGRSDEKVIGDVKDALRLVNLDFETYRDLSPFRLSGGEKRRVAIAGVLAMNPQVLILDEPTVGLDWKSTQQIEKTIKQYHESNWIVLFVTHDMDFVWRIASRIVVLKNGKIIFDGAKARLFLDEKLVKRCGLRVPRMLRLVLSVQKGGWDVPSEVYTVDDLKKWLKNRKKKKLS